jgi:hypothetical protein
MKTIHLKRTAAMAGLVCAAMGAAILFAPTVAQANVTSPPQGSQPGNLALTPGTSTDYGLVPTVHSTTPCAAPNNVAAVIALIGNDGTENVLSASIPGPVIQQAAGWNASLGSSAGDIAGIPAPAFVLGQTFEIAVDCRSNSLIHGVYTQSTFITIPADGTSAWTTSSTPPAGATATHTAVTGPAAAGVGDNVTLNATVTPNTAVGSVQFLDGAAVLATQPVSGGTAQFSTTALTTGSHTITAKFVPTDPTAFGGSTSSPITVVITSGNVQAETINVNVPASQGPFIMTVSTTPVNLGTATLSSDYTKFTASGTLSDVTVSDERNQTVPGWSVNGQMGSFSDGTHTIPGSALGWVPAVKTQNPLGDVVAGSPVAATAPGLGTASTLASAAVGKGLHTSVLTAALSFQVPSNTQPGAYTGTLTITAMP